MRDLHKRPTTSYRKANEMQPETKQFIAHVTVALSVLGGILAILAIMSMPLWACAL